MHMADMVRVWLDVPQLCSVVGQLLLVHNVCGRVAGPRADHGPGCARQGSLAAQAYVRGEEVAGMSSVAGMAIGVLGHDGRESCGGGGCPGVSSLGRHLGRVGVVKERGQGRGIGREGWCMVAVMVVLGRKGSGCRAAQADLGGMVGLARWAWVGVVGRG